jgi:pyruvate formate lyase activating enzyme
MPKNVSGIVFDIQHFSIHDGPGIRTTVFFKGCPLRCIWCHNPESISYQPELAIFKKHCIACGSCVAACPVNALELRERVVLDWDRCTQCGKCAEVCCSKALVMKGKRYRVDEILAEIESDSVFFERSGGGLTVSGGEPLAQPVFLKKLLEGAVKRGFHTAIDTSGYADWKVVESILSLVDLFLYDIKCFDTKLHKKLTGVENSRILSNLSKLLSLDVDLIVRIPIITGVNDSIDDINHIAGFLEQSGRKVPVHFLPYHRFAEQKYEQLGKRYRLKGLREPEQSRMQKLAECFKKRNIHTRIFGTQR